MISFFLTKSWRLAYLHFIEVFLANDISSVLVLHPQNIIFCAYLHEF